MKDQFLLKIAQNYRASLGFSMKSVKLFWDALSILLFLNIYYRIVCYHCSIHDIQWCQNSEIFQLANTLV